VRYVQMNIDVSFMSWGLMKGAIGLIFVLASNSLHTLPNSTKFHGD